MTRADLLEYLSIITVFGGALLYIVNRLVIIFRKLDALKGVLIVVITHLDNISAFLVKNHGLCNIATKEIVQSYLDQFNKTEKDF